MSVRWRRGALAALLFLAGFLVGLRGLTRPLGPFDEASFLVGAERVSRGEIPYRDFYALYPPGQVYTVAALFSLFPPDAVTLRLYCIAVRAALALLLFWIVRRWAGRGAALAVWLGCLLWTTASGTFGYPTFPALALVLLALLLLQPGATAGGSGTGLRSHRRLAAGAALGAAALFRHDLGAYGLVASAPLWLALPEAGAGSPADEARGLDRVPWRGWLALGIGLAATFVPPAAFLLLHAPWAEIRFELFTYPFRTYPLVRSLPYPPLVSSSVSLATPFGADSLAAAIPGLPFALPFAISAAGLLWALVRLARAPRGERKRPELLCFASLALLGLLSGNLARVRPDTVHAMAAVVASFATVGVWTRFARESRGRLLRGGVALAIGGALLLGATALASIRRIPAAGFWAALTFAPDPGRGGGLPTARGLREAAAFLRGAVPADQAIFVGCGRHDRVFVNEPLLYFLAGRRPGSKYHALDPGVVTTLPVQEEIVRGLGEQRVEWVVLSTRFDAWNEPNASSESTGVTRLDDYLRANYAVVSRFPPAIEVRRRATPWEAAPASSQPRAPVGIVGVR